MVAKKFIYRGIYHQRGQGIGALLGSLFSKMVPALSSGVRALARSTTVRKAVKAAGKEAIKTGLSAASKASRGEDVSPTVKSGLARAKKRIAAAALGPSCPKRKKPRKKLVKHKKKTASIFG